MVKLHMNFTSLCSNLKRNEFKLPLSSSGAGSSAWARSAQQGVGATGAQCVMLVLAWYFMH